MLETKFKIALLLTVLFLTGLPVMGILKGTSRPPEEPIQSSDGESPSVASPDETPPREEPIQDEMVTIPAGSPR